MGHRRLACKLPSELLLYESSEVFIPCSELLCFLGKRMDFTYLPMSVDIGLSTL